MYFVNFRHSETLQANWPCEVLDTSVELQGLAIQDKLLFGKESLTMTLTLTTGQWIQQVEFSLYRLGGGLVLWFHCHCHCLSLSLPRGVIVTVIVIVTVTVIVMVNGIVIVWFQDGN